MHPITRQEVDQIIADSHKANLVARPFRGIKNRAATEGICFCCDDCCCYFLKPDEESCDKGKLIEQTDWDSCSNCGTCGDVCYFEARVMINGSYVVKSENCFGCGLCADICSDNSISMVPRTDS